MATTAEHDTVTCTRPTTDDNTMTPTTFQRETAQHGTASPIDLDDQGAASDQASTTTTSSVLIESSSSSSRSASSSTWSSMKHFFGAVANLCSATLGAGVLALPFALYQAGLVCGFILLLASAWATSASIQLLVKASDRFQLNTYEKTVQHVLGKQARQVVEISILIFCGGTAVAYLIAVGDILQQVQEMTPATKRLAMSGVWLVAMLPLSCLKRMQSLQCASTVGIMSIGTLLLAATVHLIQDYYMAENVNEPLLDSSHRFDVGSFLWPLHNSWLSVLRACPIVVFAFSCQVNVCQIYDELPSSRSFAMNQNGAMNMGDAAKVKLMNKVTWTAVGLCGLLYSSISVVTLIDFGEGLKPNILSCYNLTRPHNGLLHAAFIGMALAVVMAFPLNIFPARVSIIQMMNAAKSSDNNILLCGSGGESDDDDCREPLLGPAEARSSTGYNSGGEDIEDPLQRLDSLESAASATPSIALDDDFDLSQHMGVTLLASGGALVLALLIPNISIVFGLLGGTTSSLLGFVVPGMLGLKIHPSDWTAWLLVVSGAVIGVLTTVVTLVSTLS
jgi:amino acid permease